MADILEVRNLGKRYPHFALEEVSFSVPPGCIMGLIGPNGAGKTTTLKLILGLTGRDSGEVRICGINPAVHGAEARSRIGFVHDEPRFYSHLTLGANAALVSPFYRTWDDSAFRHLAERFELPLQKRFHALSRGYRMKFALALALSHRAELVLMDEPTAGLDPVFRRQLLDILSGLLRDSCTSILFSTHITADLDRIADYITLLQRGRMVFSGEKDRILDDWRIVKGAPGLLDTLPPGMLLGFRRGEYGFEALTDKVQEVRRRLGEAVIFEKATFEDIIYYTGRGNAHA